MLIGLGSRELEGLVNAMVALSCSSNHCRMPGLMEHVILLGEGVPLLDVVMMRVYLLCSKVYVGGTCQCNTCQESNPTPFHPGTWASTHNPKVC